MSIEKKVAAVTAKVQAEIAELKVQLAEASANETLNVGQQYSIHVGKGETARVIEATLIGQRQRDNGSAEFRFSAGEGFDARYYDVSYNKVVLDLPEGAVTSASIAKQITRLETKIATIREKLEAQALREQLTDGETYEIKVGKGETAAVVRAVLLGQKEDEEGNKSFKFFYGAGFDAEVVVVGIKRVVLEEVQAEEVQDDFSDNAEEAV